MASKSTSRTLTDHDEIRRWAEERNARPAIVRRTHDAESSGIIRLDFPGYSGEDSLEEIEWDEWFEDFDRNQLALVVQDQTSNGEQSNFNKLVSRDNVGEFSDETSGKATEMRAEKRAGGRTSAISLSKKIASSSSNESKSPKTIEGERSKRERRKPPSKRKAA